MPASLFKCSFRMRLESYSLTFLRAILHNRKSAKEKKKTHSLMSTSLQIFFVHTSSPWLITTHQHGPSCISKIRSFQDTPGQRILPTLRKPRTIIWQSLCHYWLQFTILSTYVSTSKHIFTTKANKRKALHLYSKDIKANSDATDLHANRVWRHESKWQESETRNDNRITWLWKSTTGDHCEK